MNTETPSYSTIYEILSEKHRIIEKYRAVMEGEIERFYAWVSEMNIQNLEFISKGQAGYVFSFLDENNNKKIAKVSTIIPWNLYNTKSVAGAINDLVREYEYSIRIDSPIIPEMTMYKYDDICILTREYGEVVKCRDDANGIVISQAQLDIVCDELYRIWKEYNCELSDDLQLYVNDTNEIKVMDMGIFNHFETNVNNWYDWKNSESIIRNFIKLTNNETGTLQYKIQEQEMVKKTISLMNIVKRFLERNPERNCAIVKMFREHLAIVIEKCPHILSYDELNSIYDMEIYWSVMMGE